MSECTRKHCGKHNIYGCDYCLKGFPDSYHRNWSGEVADLQAQVAQLTEEFGLLEIAHDHKETLLDSCEKALAERDIKLSELQAQVAALEAKWIALGEVPDVEALIEREKGKDARIQQLEARNAELEGKYNDLLFHVETKIPGQSRHDTAKRYIQQCERGGNNQAEALTAGEVD